MSLYSWCSSNSVFYSLKMYVGSCSWLATAFLWAAVMSLLKSGRNNPWQYSVLIGMLILLGCSNSCGLGGCYSLVRSSGAWYKSATLSEIFIILFSSSKCQVSRLWRNYTEHYMTSREQEPVVDKSVVKLQHLSEASKRWVVSSSLSASPRRQQHFEHR